MDNLFESRVAIVTDGASGIGYARLPGSWSFNPGAVDSSMDDSNPDASAAEIESPRDWYVEMRCEVPSHARIEALNVVDRAIGDLLAAGSEDVAPESTIVAPGRSTP